MRASIRARSWYEHRDWSTTCTFELLAAACEAANTPRLLSRGGGRCASGSASDALAPRSRCCLDGSGAGDAAVAASASRRSGALLPPSPCEPFLSSGCFSLQTCYV